MGRSVDGLLCYKRDIRQDSMKNPFFSLISTPTSKRARARARAQTYFLHFIRFSCVRLTLRNRNNVFWAGV